MRNEALDGKGSKIFFFVNKKEAKKTLLNLARAGDTPEGQCAKVFCFFFSKKKRLLTFPIA
jgi:hypothetical protein